MRMMKVFLRRKKIIPILALFLSIATTYFYSNYLAKLSRKFIPPWKGPSDIKYWPVRSFSTYLDDSARCLIPQLDPFNPWGMKLLALEKEPTEEDLCRKRFPLLFSPEVDDEGGNAVASVISRREFEDFGIVSCCFREVTGTTGTDKNDTEQSDNGFRLAENCVPIPLGLSRKVSPTVEYIAIFCELKENRSKIHPVFENQAARKPILVDILYFMILKPELGQKFSDPPSEHRLNVLILGVGSVSRSNFIRAMPRSHEFLIEELEGVNMEGYSKGQGEGIRNHAEVEVVEGFLRLIRDCEEGISCFGNAKVGPNSFYSLAPLYTGMNWDDVHFFCALGRYYDLCPLIWKKFMKRGYHTAFIEDSGSTFHSEDTNGGKGFRDQPTHYYNRAPLLLAKKINGSVCLGPRLAFNVLLDYTKRFVKKMSVENKTFFYFSFSSSLTRSKMQYAKLQDEPLRNALEFMKKGGYLNHTVLIVLSDQGISSHDQDKYLGRYESRLPYMSFVFPEWFKQKHSRAYQNLLTNSRRLTTTFDLRRTLTDILSFKGLDNKRVKEREESLVEAERHRSLSQGISQFLPIPKSRTCDNADIKPGLCICDGLWKVVPEDGEQVQEAAKAVVGLMNAKLEEHESCSRLTLNQTLAAKENRVNGKQRFLVQVRTVPGHGVFEAVVAVLSWKPKVLRVLDDITRWNPFGDDGNCVRGFLVEKFCYCKKGNVSLETQWERP